MILFLAGLIIGLIIGALITGLMFIHKLNEAGYYIVDDMIIKIGE